MNFDALVSIVLSSLVTAGLFVLVGLSVVVVFRATRILNIASGQYLVLGVYVFYWLSSQEDINLALSLLAALALMLAAGAATHLVFMRPVIGQPLFVPAIVTLGLSVVLTSVVDIAWGSDARSLRAPVQNHVYHLGFGGKSAYLTTYGLLTIVVAAALSLGFVAFERWTRQGLQMRAAAEDPLLAGLSGIRINRIYMLGWALGCVASTFAGLSYAYTNVLSPQASILGFSVLAPVLLAGLDNVAALVAGSLIVGLVESFAIYWWGGTAGDPAAFAVLLLIVLIRPSGLTKTAPRLQV